MHWHRRLTAALLLPFLAACTALTPVPGDVPSRVFVVNATADADAELALLGRHAPAVTSESDWAAWNRPGALELARDHADGIVLRVDPTLPTLYGAVRDFKAASGARYRNLIYRLHFERVPHRLKPFHITAGRNGGLFVILTVNDAEEPLLVTTVHSCGCYIGFVPTNRLNKDALPAGWSVDEQVVFEESLPGLLTLPDTIEPGSRITVLLRNGTHRVADVRFENLSAARGKGWPILRDTMMLQPLSDLDGMLVSDGGFASVFNDDGYLRGAGKPLELMLMSWWALDFKIGVDKRLGKDRDDGPVFYTSLKPWNRNASDMRDFGAFLAHWGFSL